MKLSEKIIRVALLLLILISLALTYAIWLSPTAKIAEVNTSKQAVKNDQNYAKATDAFLPIRGIWDLADGKYQTSSENLLATTQARLTESTFGQLQQVAEGEEEIQSYYSLDHGIELNYEGGFSLTEYVKVFDMPISLKALKDADSISFSKIQIDFSKKKIRFLNYHKNIVYEASISADFSSLETIYQKNQNRYLAMTEENSLIPRLLRTKEQVRLKKYSYILTTQSYSLFRNAFFQNPDQAKGEEEESGARSFVSGHEEIMMDEQKRLVTFTGELPEDLEDESVYSQTFNYVSRLGTAVGNLRYFDHQDGKINYRIFVEGYPIFSQSSKGKMSVTIDPSNTATVPQVKIETSMDTVQVPIPSDEEVELPSTLEIETNLAAAGIDLSKIKSFIIGYTWQDIDGVNKLVALTPEWFVKYEDTWYSANQMMLGNFEMEAS
ncbi:two-component system activity regulator YycH [Enterococcus devriesei]|uniref:YycH family regulatory protein n=1 Tax=Enterococcus devriesei TaxID=319970 RepID=UPI00288FB749|nr:two-component system activity regulator YycH [Enterococcus devriesei]MDT2820670.1 two-component system activity regulator YycH [Enterococcus devriesei]